MKPVYTDIHIHTSDDPNDLERNYKTDILVENIKKIAGEADILLSLTDHNTINKTAYLDLKTKIDHIILGVELHIRNDKERPPYHCHLLLNLPIEEKYIDEINDILDRLYPNKIVTNSTENIPTIEIISNEFDKYDFLLLPHGGQSHHTFDKSIKRSRKFDTTIERSIYYNQFDGFTARSNSGLDDTRSYFKKLGINEFVNLITCTDNYQPQKYPEPKNPDAEAFIPTWMLASPTFEGLRLSLSEESRLVYSEKMPVSWDEYISRVELENEKLDIKVDLTPGLNVVIGGSSSGKSLFVDAVYRSISKDREDDNYLDFNTESIFVKNPSNMVPHYINQNFIISVLSNRDKGVNSIPLISKVFPSKEEIDKTISAQLADFKVHINTLIASVEEIERIQEALTKIPTPNQLIISSNVQNNVLQKLVPSETELSNCNFSEGDGKIYKTYLDELSDKFKHNAFAANLENEFSTIKTEIDRIVTISKLSQSVETVINSKKELIDSELSETNREGQEKRKYRERAINLINKYLKQRLIFERELIHISQYDVHFSTNTIEIQGHKLFIENSFVLNPETVIDDMNTLLKSDHKLSTIDALIPDNLFKRNFSVRSPKIVGYEEFANKLYDKISERNKKKYKIVTKGGKDFDNLSPGWKSAVILDLIMGYEDDNAPIIIDQPEDNLATNYINYNLIKLIKRVKQKKQIIMVSHNATIPMLGDAQTIVLCENQDGIIRIVSQPLEGQINDKSMVDYIAEITDGGKASIKKRSKKYNLKTFKEELSREVEI